MTTIKYALREVRKYFGRYLPIYAQIITSVLLFAFIAVTFDQARVFSAKMYEYSEHKNMYAVVDKTDVPTIMNTLTLYQKKKTHSRLSFFIYNDCIFKY